MKDTSPKRNTAPHAENGTAARPRAGGAARIVKRAFSGLLTVMKHGGAFLLLAALTLWIILRGQDMPQLAAIMKSADIRFILPALLAMVVFAACEGGNICCNLRLLGDRAPFRHCFKYALVGFFFSSVTPSASGGQPMQLVYMKRDGLDLSHAAAALLLELSGFQCAAVFLGLAGLFTQRAALEQAGVPYLILLCAGIACNLVLLAVVLLGLFMPRVSRMLISAAAWIMRLLHIKNADKHIASLGAQLDEYRRCAEAMGRRPAAFVRLILVSVIQLASYHAVTYLVYRALGFSGVPWCSAIALQALLFVSVSAIPTPGAVGVSEGGFLALQRVLFPDGVIGSAMLLCRGISFYIPLAVSGTVIALLSLRAAVKRKRTKQ